MNPGFVTERALSMQLGLPETRYRTPARDVGFYQRLPRRSRIAAGRDGHRRSRPPCRCRGSDIGVGFTIEGRPADPGHADVRARTSASARSTSRRWGFRSLRGRAFTERDNEQGAAVLVISEAMAAKYWPDEDPIGKRITIGYNKTGPREIVGIVGDVKQRRRSPTPQSRRCTTPFVQTPWPFLSAVVRTTAAPGSAAGSLRADAGAARSAAGRWQDPKTLDEYVARSIATPRFTALLVGSFAALALLLGGFGLSA